MLESWRWYGPLDNIGVEEIAQAGAAGVVTALHEIPYGEVWPTEAIRARKALIENNPALGLQWNVVESLPVHERIKRGDGDLEPLFANYRQSMKNLAAEGIKVICYNFMPLLDWTRTDLAKPLERGGHALHFSATRMAAFELFMLGREAAKADYSPKTIEAAKEWFETSSEHDQNELLASIMSGLPGAYDRYDCDTLKDALVLYEGIDQTVLRENYRRFLEAVIPTAEELGMRLCVHPDDPPRDILGLPRIVSDSDDIEWILNTVDSPSNGLTLCAGSLGANPKNNVPEIAAKFADKIHFAHLRNVKKYEDGSFTEWFHLEGDTDMVALIRVLMEEELRRSAANEGDSTIPFRPDHGHALLDDLARKSHPGYPLIGRMRGLAELKGVITAIRSSNI
ncbi:MAG: mannonate dehydratase [Pseudomonadota bacterium]